MTTTSKATGGWQRWLIWYVVVGVLGLALLAEMWSRSGGEAAAEEPAAAEAVEER